MKKRARQQYAQQIEASVPERRHVTKDFSRLRDYQIENAVLFLSEQRGLLASRIAQLGEWQKELQEQPDFSQITELREAFRAIGQDLLKPLYYIEINAVGLRKILKKFEKRLGYKFTDYYVKTRANHPYSHLQQVLRHVGLGAVIGAISRNLGELQDCQGIYLSIYDQPSLPVQVVKVNCELATSQDPVIDSLNAAIDRSTHSTNFLDFLAKHSFIIQEDLPAPC